MGLDIIKHRVVAKDTEGASQILLPIDNPTPNQIALFEHFSDFVSEEIVEYYDWVATFKSLGLDANQYALRSERYDDHLDEWVSTFHHKDYQYEDTDKNPPNSEITIALKDAHLSHEPTKILYVVNVPGHYQRKGMSVEFYSHYYGGCWYVADSAIPEEEGIMYAYTQEMLDRAKGYADQGEPILNWVLEEDEFVYFSA